MSRPTRSLPYRPSRANSKASPAATDLVESLPMPESVYAIVAEFVAEHQVDRPFVKRQRDRASPAAMARAATLKDGK